MDVLIAIFVLVAAFIGFFGQDTFNVVLALIIFVLPVVVVAFFAVVLAGKLIYWNTGSRGRRRTAMNVLGAVDLITKYYANNGPSCYEDDYLIIEYGTIYLKNWRGRKKLVFRGNTIESEGDNPPKFYESYNVYEFHDGKWVDYVLYELEPRARKIKRRQLKAQMARDKRLFKPL